MQLVDFIGLGSAVGHLNSCAWWRAKTHGFKRLGEPVMARTFERQVAQVHERVARLNRFKQLGRPTTVPVAAMAWLRLGRGLSRCAFDLCNKAGASWSSPITTPVRWWCWL
jgi:hypothetical protein